AGSLVMSLMFAPRWRRPDALNRHLGGIDIDAAVQSARQSSVMLLLSYGLLPLAIWAGVTNWPLMIVLCVLVGAMSFDGFRQARTQKINLAVPVVLGVALLFVLSRLMG